MTKILHVFVYLFVALAGAALWFELQLNARRDTLADRGRLQEDYLIKIASTIEKADPDKGVATEMRMDVSPVEAKIVDTPETANLLEDYKFYLEKQSLETFSWGIRERQQLRDVYVTDAEGKPVMDGGRPLMDGPGTEKELLEQLFQACVAQQARLNTTRGELKNLRDRFEETVAEVNKLKPELRQSLVAKEEAISAKSKIQNDLTTMETQRTKLKAQIDELNVEIASLRDEAVSARDETDAAKEELAKSLKQIEQLKQISKEALAKANAVGEGVAEGPAVSNLPAGDKGQVIEADGNTMYAIVKLSDEALKELMGDDLKKPLPRLELAVKRPGYKGPAGEFIGRLRLRQAVPGKNYVICDILANWSQGNIQTNDVVFAD